MVFDRRRFLGNDKVKLDSPLNLLCRDYILSIIHCDDKKRQHLHFLLSINILKRNEIEDTEDNIITLHGIISQALTDNLDVLIGLPEFPVCEDVPLYGRKLEVKIYENEIGYIKEMFEVKRRNSPVEVV